MGLTKKMLDDFFEVSLSTYPDDLDSDYQEFLEQKKLEQSVYEELLSDTYKTYKD